MFFKGVGTISSNEALLYNYWTVMFTLLREGLPWDYLVDLPGGEITLLLAVNLAMKERENDMRAKMGG